MNAYGQECTRHFAGELARAGLTIVSGFAIGIDSLAHDTALECSAPTVAVLGCGLDADYPAGSRERAAAIASTGAVVTEFPLGCHPKPMNFPIRNRLIAALADATLVIQARLRSGSLITAGHALDLGREIFAVPGAIFDELAMGTNELIAAGAHPALCARDLLERLGIAATAAPPSSRTVPPASGNPLLDRLTGSRDGLLAEDLATATGQPLDRVLGALLELELEGRIERRPGPLYVARNPKT
jgi:DNA processing protein